MRERFPLKLVPILTDARVLNRNVIDSTLSSL